MSALAVFLGGTMSVVGISDAIRNIMLDGPVSADPRGGAVALEGSAPMTPEEKAARKRERNHAYYVAHREQHNANGKAWRDANLERARVNERASGKARYWADPEKFRTKSRTDMAAAYARGRRQGEASMRRAWLKHRFGFTEAEWQSLYDSQGGVCAICQRPEPGSRRLSIDHDHATGHIRGLLCTGCNIHVGRVESLRSGKYRAFEDWIDRADPKLGKVRYVSPDGWDRSPEPHPQRGRPRLAKEVCHLSPG